MKREKFMWGASIAMYQTDGADNAQWAVWERQNARRLAAADHKRFDWVPGHSMFAKEAASPSNYICGESIKHREHYRKDFKLLKSLGINTFRFSVEWARVEPKPSEFNQDEINFIKEYIKEIKRNGLTPILTLWHWTMPTWFTDLKAFEKQGNIKYFTRYAQYIIRNFKEDVKWILTLNEPMVYSSAGYISGEWPPNQIGIFRAMRVGRNLAIAHNQTYKLAKKLKPGLKISVSHNTAYIHGGDNKLSTLITVAYSRYQRDSFFLNRTYKHMDFLGVNWYTSDTYMGHRLLNPNEYVSDLGWDLRPHDIVYSLNYLWRTYRLPILITENGLADGRDKYRKWWLDETFLALQTAHKLGVRLLGYCHWSAFDNFEWDKGFWPRFGLIKINLSTLERQIRPSAKHYAKLIKSSKL